MDIELPVVDQEKVNALKKKHIEEIYQNEELVSFLDANHLDKTFVYKHLDAFLRVLEDKKECALCPGLSSCKKKGYCLKLSYERGFLKYDYHYCTDKMKRSRIKDHFVVAQLDENCFDDSPKGLLKVFKNERTPIVTQMALSVKKNDFSKGMYLYGPEKVGKSYILGVYAKSIACNIEGKYIAYLDYPGVVMDLIDDSFRHKNEFDSTIALYSSIPFLFLDNFGMEKASDFAKEHITLAILKARKEASLPTFIASRYSPRELYSVYKTPGSGTFFVRDLIQCIESSMNVYPLNTMKYPF